MRRKRSRDVFLRERDLALGIFGASARVEQLLLQRARARASRSPWRWATPPAAISSCVGAFARGRAARVRGARLPRAGFRPARAARLSAPRARPRADSDLAQLREDRVQLRARLARAPSAPRARARARVRFPARAASSAFSSSAMRARRAIRAPAARARRLPTSASIAARALRAAPARRRSRLRCRASSRALRSAPASEALRAAARAGTTRVRTLAQSSRAERGRLGGGRAAQLLRSFEVARAALRARRGATRWRAGSRESRGRARARSTLR